MKRRKRFAILIGVAAVGVMALGAQTAAPAQAVVKYDTKVTIRWESGRGDGRFFFYGFVESRKKCEVGRRVTLFKQRPGTDRLLGTVRSGRDGGWRMQVPQRKAGSHVYAEVSPKVGDGFVCSGDRSPLVKGIPPVQEQE